MRCGLHRNDASRLYIQRNLTERETSVHCRRTMQTCSSIPLNPVAGGKADRRFSELRILCDRLRYRIGENTVAEHVFVLGVVRFGGFRPVIVERPQESNTRIVGFSGFGVDVGLHLVTTHETLPHQVRVGLGIRREAPLRWWIFCGVSRRRGATL